MFEIEARWVGTALAGIDFDGGQIECLNLGSSTRQFREREQPFIHEFIFRPLEGRCVITHCDMKKADGVDLIGDLADPAFVARLSRLRFDLIICTNLLMHLEQPELVYELIQKSLRPGGRLILTTPALYPYCGDPVDSKYRPSAEEIIAQLPALTPIKYETLVLKSRHADSLLKSPRSLVALLANVLFPFWGLKKWRRTASDLPHLFHNYKVACVLMVKHA